ncbi:MAG: hypothetical protein B6I36_02965, partial [Desulfobacteraceae bacterium 4572_35.1]
LGIPNKEVQLSFNDMVIDYLTGQPVERTRYQDKLYEYLENGDVDALGTTIKTLFAGIAYNNYVNNTISSYEGYYASVIYAYLASLGLEIIPEDVTNKGRIDLTIKIADNIYILEFKVDGGDPVVTGAETALQQIKDKDYQQKYIHDGKTIYLIGIDFDAEKKNVSSVKWEKV